MPYPSRGAWQFKSVNRSFDFWPVLSSIEITQSYPDMVATFSCEVVANDDTHPEYEFEAEDEVRVIFAGDRIFAGHLKGVTETQLSEVGPRKWMLEAQDYTAKLGDAIIRLRQHRRQENARNRIRWILSYLDNAWHIDGQDLHDVPDEQVERQDMYGMTVAEALDSVSNEVGLHYWIDLDNKLHVAKAATIPAPFDLDNEDPDYSTSFPFRDFAYTKDSVDLANAVLVEPEKREDSRWSVSNENIENYAHGDSTGRQEQFISAEEIRTARGASRHGDAQLQRLKFQKVECTLTVHEPGIIAGMWVSLHEALWDRTQNLRVVNVNITALDPHDADGTAYLVSALTLTSKPKRRSPKMGRPEERTGNPSPSPLDGFDREVTPSAPVPDDTFAPTLTDWRLEWSMVGSFGGAPLTPPHPYTPGSPTTPTMTGIGPTGRIAWDTVGYQNTSWPYVDCGVGQGANDGWREFEYWASFTVPTKPAGFAGIYVEVAVGGYFGAASSVIVRASPSQPTQPRSAGSVGLVTGASGTVFIPGNLVPAAGQTMWVGIAPGWAASHDYGYYCVHSPPAAAYTGGRAEPVSFGTWTWATAGSDIDLGTNDSPAGAPWEGGGQWQLAGIDGTPTDFGMDGDAFFVTAEEPAGVGIYLDGQYADDTNPTQPFSGPSGYEVEFILDALGDTGEAGTRTIEITTTGDGGQTIGTIHLGDMNNPAGVTITGGPTSVNNVPVTLTANERYRASFDTRSGQLVAKIWRVSDGEPAGVVVLGDIEATEDTGDRFMLWLRSGNGTGSPQTIRVTDIDAMISVPAGGSVQFEWIGFASGDTDRFRTRHRHLMGTLVAHVNGIDCHAVFDDGIEFRLDAFPTAMSGVHASYIVADEVQE